MHVTGANVHNGYMITSQMVCYMYLYVQLVSVSPCCVFCLEYFICSGLTLIIPRLDY